jgi:hypothetical protein
MSREEERTSPETPSKSKAITAAGLAATLTSPPMVVILWLGVIFHLIALSYQLAGRENHFDFSIYYASGLALQKHIDPYTTDLDRVSTGLNLEIDPIHFATDPPTFLLCFEPFSRLPVRTAFWLWTALNFIALVASIVLLLRGSGLSAWTILALAALSLLYAPVGEHFFYGQNKIFVLLALVLMLRWLEAGHDSAAGLILGVVALMRWFPLLMVGYLIIRHRWRALTYTAIGLVLGGLATVAFLGVAQTLSFRHGLQFVTRYRFLALPINISVGAFVSRIYWYAIGPHAGISDSIRKALVGIAEIGMLGLTITATMRHRDRRDFDYRAFSLWVVTAVMLSPTAWVHYLVLMLIPFIQMAIAANCGRSNDRAIWMAVASFMLIAVSTSGRTAFGPHPHGAIPIVVAECSFVSLAMAYVSAYWFANDEVWSRPRTQGREKRHETFERFHTSHSE